MTQEMFWSNEDAPPVDPDQIARAYLAALSPPLPAIRLPLAGGIKTVIAAALRREPKMSLAAWVNYFQGVRDCPFLLGKVKPWKANLIWLLGPQNMAKVEAGAYVSVEAPTPERAQRIRDNIGKAYGLHGETSIGTEHHHGIPRTGSESRGDQLLSPFDS